MPEIPHSEIKRYLDSLKTASGESSLPPAMLIYGDELLYKNALQQLLDRLLPSEKQTFNYEPVDGIPENVSLAIENVNTYAFFSGQKIVGFLDTRIFYASKNAPDILEKIRESCNGKDFKTASRYFFSLLSVMNLSLDDVRDKDYKGLNLEMDAAGDTLWLDNLIDYCLENQIEATTGRDGAKLLQQAVEKGFPASNHLILTADMVDKRKGLYKTILEKGLVIDCSVPKGEAWADKQAQIAMLGEQIRTILQPTGKTMDKAAFQKLVEITGFDLRLFAGNLEKLVQYTGNRNTITQEDVESILTRTRQDPIFEMTSAITERNAAAALFYLKSLLSRGFFPLQITAAIVRQIRKLLIVKDFLESPYNKFWKPGWSFEQFNKHYHHTILPALQAYDASLIERLAEWGTQIEVKPESKEAAPAAKKKKTSLPATDMLLVKQPVKPYFLFSLMQKAEQFSMQELIQSIFLLDQANLSLKAGMLNPELISENVILKICGLPDGQKA